MPNWCEGTLRVRGKKEDLKKFVVSALQPIDFKGITGEKLSFNEIEEATTNATCYIEGTRRGFIDCPGAYLGCVKEGEIGVLCFDTRFAWNVVATELLALCVRYSVDMRLYAFERGQEFNRDIEIVDKRIVKDNEITFDDYAWECICPELGG